MDALEVYIIHQDQDNYKYCCLVWVVLILSNAIVICFITSHLAATMVTPAESSKRRVIPSSHPTVKTVFLVYPCHICDNHPGYKTAARCITHIREHHGYVLPSRKVSVHRPKSKDFIYQTNFNDAWDEQQFACPSCWHHTDDMKALGEHIWKHDPGVIQPIRASGTSASNVDFVYDGTFFKKQEVRQIFQDISDLTSKFREILSLKNKK